MIVLVGPDGCGKSAVSSHLCQHEDVARVPINFRPHRLDRWLRRRRPGAGVSDRPHSTPERSLRGGIAKLAYIVADLSTIRLDARRARHSGKWLVVERYAYDLVVDPTRTGLKSVPALLRELAIRCVPSPHSVYVLLGDADEIYRRKPELALTEIKRQLKVWHDYAPRTRLVFLDSSNDNSERIAEKIMADLGLTW